MEKKKKVKGKILPQLAFRPKIIAMCLEKPDI